MADEQQKIKDNYVENLKAEDYFQAINEAWKEIPEIFRFMLMFINDVMRSGRFKGSKLLEIGSGATVHSIASASAYFPNITMSDYVENNVENLKQWLQGNSNLVQLLEIQAGLEGFGNDIESGVKILESRIRESVKRVTRCDILMDAILLDTDSIPETSPPYDVIISCLCLEVAPKDFNGYVDIIKRINKLLKPGGGLLICGFFGGHEWTAGDKEFHHIKIGESDLLDALAKSGFKKIDIKTIGSEKKISYQFDKLYCCVAQKL